MSDNTDAAATDAAADAAPATTEQPQGDPANDKPLGENGEKALKAERDARKAAEGSAAALQKQLDEINAANLTDLERAQKAAQDATETAEKATKEAMRLRVAAKHGISDDDADLFLTGSDMETVERQAAALAARTSTGPKPDLSQGARGGPIALNSNGLEQALKSKLGIS